LKRVSQAKPTSRAVEAQEMTFNSSRNGQTNLKKIAKFFPILKALPEVLFQCAFYTATQKLLDIYFT
jgi:hypothetical protein